MKRFNVVMISNYRNLKCGGIYIIHRIDDVDDKFTQLEEYYYITKIDGVEYRIPNIYIVELLIVRLLMYEN